MRLTCPNCSARYEVADSMIPPEGRDVQCSNCSTTWFQPGRRVDHELDAGVDSPAREASVMDPAVGAVAEATGDEPAAPRRREIDPKVREILREEAERETRLRQAEAAPVETQAEMPLAEEDVQLHRARRRAELEAAEDAFAADAPAPAVRDQLPDIDEINSTLRDAGDRSTNRASASDIDTLDTAPHRRRGTRIGFFLALALVAGGVGVYLGADQIAASVPALEPVLDGYVATVASVRFWLDDLAQRLGSISGEG